MRLTSFAEIHRAIHDSVDDVIADYIGAIPKGFDWEFVAESDHDEERHVLEMTIRIRPRPTARAT